MPPDAPVFVDTVDRFQGQERDVIIASYAVADRDFVASEEEFILEARRFNVTQIRRSKFVMFVNNLSSGIFQRISKWRGTLHISSCSSRTTANLSTRGST
jgi:hypothetical protein